MKLDPTKEYQYRNGEKPWKIIWDVPNDIYPIVTIDKEGDVNGHLPDGRWFIDDESQHDLVEVKKKIKGWVNVYETAPHVYELGALNETKPDKDIHSAAIACIEIEFEEGEGLDPLP